MEKIVTVYVKLLEEGSPTMRGTDAMVLGEDSFKLMATPCYDPEDEICEFPPGSIVRCESRDYRGEELLFAVEKVG